MIVIGGKAYELITDHKNGWNQEVFRERYSDVLDRYDYVVGDWGYNQLRLRGFFKDNNPKATKESAISSIQDYLNEYCNFGCAYFVVERLAGRNIPEGEEGDTAAAESESANLDESAAGADDMNAYTHRAEALQQSQPPLRTHMRPQHRPRPSQMQTSQLSAQGTAGGAANRDQQSSKPQYANATGQQQQGKHQQGQNKQQGVAPAQSAQQGGKGQQGPANQNRSKTHHGGRPQHKKSSHSEPSPR